MLVVSAWTLIEKQQGGPGDAGGPDAPQREKRNNTHTVSRCTGGPLRAAMTCGHAVDLRHKGSRTKPRRPSIPGMEACGEGPGARPPGTRVQGRLGRKRPRGDEVAATVDSLPTVRQPAGQRVDEAALHALLQPREGRPVCPQTRSLGRRLRPSIPAPEAAGPDPSARQPREEAPVRPQPGGCGQGPGSRLLRVGQVPPSISTLEAVGWGLRARLPQEEEAPVCLRPRGCQGTRLTQAGEAPNHPRPGGNGTGLARKPAAG